MITIEASVDEEVLPYLEHLASILGSFEYVADRSLQAYFASLKSQDNATYDTFEALLTEERDRVFGAMRARNDTSDDGDTVFQLELTWHLHQWLKNYMETFNTTSDDIIQTAILALSVVEEILETNPEACFLMDGQPLPLSFFLRTKDDPPPQFH